MKRKYVYLSLEIIAILAVTYPVIWSVYAGTTSGNAPFSCPPLIPCDNNAQPVSTTCTTFCIINIQNAAFSPANINVTQGATLEWVNLDSIAHTSTAVYSGAWNSGVIPPGGHFLLTVNLAPGTYYYQCNVHPFMTGQINVLPAGST
ncbi:MAG: cupredoxin domain-containing protein [Nitrososphaerota archaeon]|nr:cupredoxin domain-containing protein [Nitrososphaerota archaeon]MDG7010702.1 cupredoxin domain-containing protein [Nitrososphaerota archaeon]